MNKKAKVVEEIEAIGQEDERKAIKWLDEKQKEENKLKKKEENILKEELSRARKQQSYKFSLLEYMIRLRNSYQLPKGYYMGIKINEKGLAIYIKDKEGRMFGKGTKISGIPKYDINAVERLVFNGLDLIDSFESRESDIMIS